MRSQLELEKVCGEIKKTQRPGVKSYHIEDIIGNFLYNNFTEQPGSNLQNFGQSKALT